MSHTNMSLAADGGFVAADDGSVAADDGSVAEAKTIADVATASAEESKTNVPMVLSGDILQHTANTLQMHCITLQHTGAHRR